MKSDDLGANRNEDVTILLLLSKYLFPKPGLRHEVTISDIQEYDRGYFEVIVEYSVLKVLAGHIKYDTGLLKTLQRPPENGKYPLISLNVV